MDIKVGEYVRTKRGIAKILEVKIVQPKMYGKQDKAYLIDKCPRMYITETEFIKHSFNLIDLIEVGDYVNGYKVISVDKNATENCIECIELDRNNAYEYQFISSKDIQSILTHEQFEANCYKVKGE